MPQSGPFCFRNSTDVPVNGLHVIFADSRGTISEGQLTVGPPGRIQTTENQLNVFLDAPLAPGSPLCFTVGSEAQPINVYIALWTTDFNVAGRAEQIK